MLNPQAHARGFSVIAVVGALIIISLLTVSALQLVQDHRRRAALSADHAFALHEAEVALATAECELALATGTPSHGDCTAAPDAARVASLDPATLAGFVPGRCGEGTTRGLCWPQSGQTAQALAKLLGPQTDAAELAAITTTEWRQPTRHARYVIEPIPDTQPGQWVHAGMAPTPSFFRITAAGFGFGADPEVSVMLQTVYRPRVVQP